ncbi:hypothetical protein PCANC_28949 [Puccinia coronata f. sp. avenae]|uniref:Uncharacterized protein n=1 Tax=Puccinia coronata f. sp. avenae TaxID=200324 RepID=A0A2N5RTR6_9BASI|nr:hypothetical protein PCANC_28949 [Puccinia coronata f. sp. avenae]
MSAQLVGTGRTSTSNIWSARAVRLAGPNTVGQPHSTLNKLGSPTSGRAWLLEDPSSRGVRPLVRHGPPTGGIDHLSDYILRQLVGRACPRSCWTGLSDEITNAVMHMEKY